MDIATIEQMLVLGGILANLVMFIVQDRKARKLRSETDKAIVYRAALSEIQEAASQLFSIAYTHAEWARSWHREEWPRTDLLEDAAVAKLTAAYKYIDDRSLNFAVLDLQARARIVTTDSMVPPDSVALPPTKERVGQLAELRDVYASVMLRCKELAAEPRIQGNK